MTDTPCHRLPEGRTCGDCLHLDGCLWERMTVPASLYCSRSSVSYRYRLSPPTLTGAELARLVDGALRRHGLDLADVLVSCDRYAEIAEVDIAIRFADFQRIAPSERLRWLHDVGSYEDHRPVWWREGPIVWNAMWRRGYVRTDLESGGKW